jgi:hypothetical protein
MRILILLIALMGFITEPAFAKDPLIEEIKKSAHDGSRHARTELGNRFMHGDGVYHDTSEGFNHTKKLAEEGDAAAQNKLGMMYWYGIGVDKNNLYASEWIKKSVEQNYAEAQYNLALLHLYCGCLEPNDDKVVDLMSKSAEQAFPPAMVFLSILHYEEFNDMALNEENKKKALKLLTEAAHYQDPYAQLVAAWMYHHGALGVQNSIDAYIWYSLAAKKGVEKAAYYRDMLAHTMSGEELQAARSKEMAFKDHPDFQWREYYSEMKPD